jgi:hypothetical protein
MKLKIGQKVYNKVEKKWGTITGLPGDEEYDNSRFAVASQGCTLMYEGDGEYEKWTFTEDLEEYIEPKYQVGDIVYCYPSSRKPGYMEDTCEIVKFALNKKKSAYSYLAFNDNGYIFCFQEDEVLLVGKCRNCGAKI